MRKSFLKKGKNIAAGVLLAFSMILGMGSMAVQADETVVLEDGGSLTGTYLVVDGWVEDTEESDDSVKVYKQSAFADLDATSTITCSYLDTNYSVLEYEQLRDMLTDNLFYSHVDAQISTSAVYTKEKDCLYIVIVDESMQEYRDIYHYVVGDYRCFCVEVREYRAEADTAKQLDQKTPQEAGMKMAQEFVWNTAW